MVQVTNHFIKAANRAIDFFLRVDAHESLNTGSTNLSLEHPAAEMMKSSKTLLALGIDAASGKVDYAALDESEAYRHFREISRSLNSFDPGDFKTVDEATTFWINLYNALIVDGIIHYKVSGSLLRRPGFFRQVAYTIGGMRFSADAIEHGVLRSNRPNPALPVPFFAHDDPRCKLYEIDFDPRIHFTLVCGANSCPPISFYEADKLPDQLELAAAVFVNGNGVRFDAERDTLWLSSIFKWYQVDFGGLKGVLDFVRSHLRDSVISAKIATGQLRVRYMDYDWAVNRLA
jgi:hypothetical protein